MRNLAILYRDMGEWNQALDLAEQALAVVDPNDGTTAQQLGQLIDEVVTLAGSEEAADEEGNDEESTNEETSDEKSKSARGRG